MSPYHPRVWTASVRRDQATRWTHAKNAINTSFSLTLSSESLSPSGVNSLCSARSSHDEMFCSASWYFCWNSSAWSSRSCLSSTCVCSCCQRSLSSSRFCRTSFSWPLTSLDGTQPRRDGVESCGIFQRWILRLVGWLMILHWFYIISVIL